MSLCWFSAITARSHGVDHIAWPGMSNADRLGGHVNMRIGATTGTVIRKAFARR